MRLEIPEAEKRYRFHRSRTIAAERRLWGVFRRFPLRVLRQHDVGDGFVADFAMPDARILVELDGPHDLKRQDAQVTSSHARKTRWRLIRLHADDVLEDFESVMALVKAEIGAADVMRVDVVGTSPSAA
jgi:very-short-patch-repair endonuclease